MLRRPPAPIRSPILSGQRTQHLPHPRGWNQIRRPVLLHPPRRDRAEPPASPPPPPFTYPNWTELRLVWTRQALAEVCLRLRSGSCLVGGPPALGARQDVWQRWYPGEPGQRSPRSAPAPREGPRPSPPPLAGPGAGHLPTPGWPPLPARLALQEADPFSAVPLPPPASQGGIVISGPDSCHTFQEVFFLCPTPTTLPFPGYSAPGQAGTQGPSQTTGYNPFAMVDPLLHLRNPPVAPNSPRS